MEIENLPFEYIYILFSLVRFQSLGHSLLGPAVNMPLSTKIQGGEILINVNNVFVGIHCFICVSRLLI